MERKERRKFSSDFKTKVVLESLKEKNTIEELSRKYELHPNQISTWKKDFLSKASSVFASSWEVSDDKKKQEAVMEKLYAKIGQQKVEIDWLKKKLIARPLSERRMVVSKQSDLSLTRQCELLSIHRSGLYYKPCAESEENLAIMRLLDEQYMRTPFYGIRRLRAWLCSKGIQVNRKRVKRLMQLMGWETLYRKPNTSWKNKAHKTYPYLLKDLAITERNQAWGIDITYVPMRRGFMYLCAIIDLHTRYVVNWSLSNTMTAGWVRGVVEEAITEHGRPKIINSDQGSQFTSFEYTSLFDQEMKISMDGKGRAIDNIFIERLWKSVKYECIYLNVFDDGVKLYEGLQSYFNFYNKERIHQSLDYKTPESLYKNAA